MTTRNTACVSVAPYIKVVNIVVILLNVMVHDSSLSNKMIHVIKEKLVNRCYVGGGGYTNTSYSGSSMLIWTGTSHCEISLADLTPDVPGDVLCLLVALICVRAHITIITREVIRKLAYRTTPTWTNHFSAHFSSNIL